MLMKTDPRRLVATAFIGLSALAWLTLLVWGQSPYSRFLGHHDLDLVTGNASLIVIFIAGWLVMTIAMMLPTILPLLTLFYSMTRLRSNRLSLLILLLFGYLVSWTVFGALVYVNDFALHRAVANNDWLAAQAWLFSALTLIVAGLYQFTPLKYYCLDKCRSPLGFITRYWHGNKPKQEALTLGIHHGLFCVGCCWSLMLLNFAIGAGNLGWMFMLGAIMTIEKNLPWGRCISRPLGVALLVWGSFYLLFSIGLNKFGG